jgi:hypothetical protein
LLLAADGGFCTPRRARIDPFQPKAILRVMDRSTLRPVVESSKESESTSGDPAAPRYCQ